MRSQHFFFHYHVTQPLLLPFIAYPFYVYIEIVHHAETSYYMSIISYISQHVKHVSDQNMSGVPRERSEGFLGIFHSIPLFLGDTNSQIGGSPNLTPSYIINKLLLLLNYYLPYKLHLPLSLPFFRVFSH